jgi:MFS family permease
MINFAMLMAEQLEQGPAAAGTIASAAGFIGIAAGILYKNIVSVLKQNILAIGAIIITCGLVVSFIATNVPVFFIGFALITLGFTFGFTGGMHAMAKVVPREKIASSMGLFMGCQSLGSMICPYVINPIADKITGVSSALGNYQVTTVFGVIVIVYALVWGVKHRKYYQELPDTAAAK